MQRAIKLFVLSLLVLHCSAVPESTLFRYGPGARDSLLPQGQASIDLELQRTLLYDNLEFSNISVSSLGVISLGQPLLSGSREFSTDQSLIAPFWTSYDYSQSGQVYYRESNDESDRILASDRFTTAVGRTVTIDSVIVVTWNEMLGVGSMNQTNTFQCVIGTSGHQTFVIFYYLTERMQWAGSPLARVGVTSGTRVTALPTSGTEQTLQVSISGNMGEEGGWLWRVDGAADIPGGVIGWEELEYSMTEDGDLQVCISLHSGILSSSPMIIRATTQSGSAETGSDFPSFQRDLTISSTAQFPMCITVPINDDTTVENEEVFTLSLQQRGRITSGAALLPLRTTIHIQDNDNATVTPSTPTVFVDEDAGILCVKAALKDTQGNLVRTEKDVSANYFIRPGTALVNEDFQSVLSGSINFIRGTAETCVYITIQDDHVFENDEVFYVSFSELESQERITVDSVTMTSITIQDDDASRVVIEYNAPSINAAYSNSPSYTINEGESVTTCLSITAGELRGTFDVFLQTRLPLELVHGTRNAAVSGRDYIRQERTFTFDPSNAHESQCLTIQTTDDILYEGIEFFGLDFSSETPVPPGRAVVFIEDNDEIDVSLIRNRFDFIEGQDTNDILICANRTGQLERRLAVSVTPRLVTASFRNFRLRVGDVNPTIDDIVFEPDESEACTSVIVYDDYVFEDEEETFDVWLSNSDTRLIHFPVDSATVAIHDDERVIIQFKNPANPVEPGTVSESGTIVPEVCLVRDIGNDIPIRVFLTPINGTATEKEDYNATEEALVFEPTTDEDVFRCPSISLVLFDDPVVEGDEQVLLKLTSMEPERIIVTDYFGNPRTAALTIKDDDKVFIHMTEQALMVNEGEGGIDVCISFRGYTARSFSVSLSTIGVTARENIDYVPQTLILELPPTNETILSDLYALSPSERVNRPALVSNLCARILIIDDQVLEEFGSKSLLLVLSESDPNLQLEDPRTVSVTIMDDDSVTVDLETESITVSEDVGTVRVCARLSGTAEFSIAAQFNAVPISASARTDYVITSSIIEFPPLSTGEQCAEFEIIDDNILEHTEEFTVRLSVTTRNSNIRTGANDSLTVAIRDNDFMEVGFSERDYSELESAGSVEVCAQLVGRTERAVSATFFTRDASRGPHATADVDYVPVSNITLFNNSPFRNGGRECLTISLTDDVSLEDTESFEVVLRSGDSGVRTTAQSVASVYILDDDGVRMGLQEREYEVLESQESFPVCLELIGRIQKNITMEFSTDSISATSDSDFPGITLQQIVFQPSQADTQTLCVNISVTDDTIYETTESFSIYLNEDIPDVLISFHISNATVFILDDDEASVSFEALSYSIVEGAGQVEVCLVMDERIETEVECVITTQPDSATLSEVDGSADYTFSGPVSLVFPPSADTQKQCTQVSIVDDEILESIEQFVLVAASGSPRVTVSQNKTTVYITDDDTVSAGFVQLSFNVSEDVESERNLTLCLQLTGEIERDVMVTVATTSSEHPLAVATEGRDYVPLERELVYRPDQLNQTHCVTVEVLDDRLVEAVEQFDVSITNASPGVEVPEATQRVTVSISDEDVVCERSNTDTSRGFFEWQETYPNVKVAQICVNGTASRRCNSKGIWEPPQVDDCFATIDAILKHIFKNLPVEDGLSIEYLRELIKALHRLRVNEPEGLNRFIKPIYEIFEGYAQNVTNDVVQVREVVYELILEVVDIFHYPEWPKYIIQEESVRLLNSVEAITVGLIGNDGFKKIDTSNAFLGFLVEKGLVNELLPGEQQAKTVIFEHFADSGVVGQLLSSVGGGRKGRFLASISLPSSIAEQVSEENVGLYFAFYDNNVLFPLPNNTVVNSSTHVVSPVVMATVSETKIQNLKDVINYTIVINGTDYFDAICVSWDFTANEGKGNWSTEGCQRVSGDKGSSVTCSCTHLTNFAVLLDIQERPTPGPPEPDPILSAILIVGVGISLLGLTLTMVTLILFSNLRRRDTTVYRIQFCLSVALMLLAFVCGIERVDLFGLCVSISALIHYFTLVSLLWMAAEALLMFQKLIVTAKISVVYFVIASIVCWLLPVPAVVIPIGIDRNFSIHGNYCFISHNVVFYAAFLGPIAAILLFNLLIFFIAFILILRYSSSKYSNNDRAKKRRSATRTIFTILTVMLMFGLTWIFGAFTVLRAPDYFQYLFVIFNSFQGLFIFLIFVVFAKETRELWLQTCGCRKRKEDDGIYELNPSRRVSRNPSLRKTDDDYDSEIDYNFDGTDRLEALKALDRDARINMNSWDVMYIMPQNTFDIFLDSNQFQPPPPPSVPMASAATATASNSKQSSPSASISPKRPSSANDAGIREDQSTADSGIMMDQSKNNGRSPKRLIGEPITTQSIEESETKRSSYHVHSVSGIGYVSADSDDEFLDRASPPILATPPTKRRSKVYGDRFKREMQTCINSEHDPEQGVVTTDFRVEVQ